MTGDDIMTPDEFFRLYREFGRRWTVFLRGSSPANTAAPHAGGFKALHICYYAFRHPGCALHESAAAVGLSTGAASALVDSLCGRGLLLRTPAHHDRRRIELRTTGRFDEFFRKLCSEMAKHHIEYRTGQN